MNSCNDWVGEQQFKAQANDGARVNSLFPDISLRFRQGHQGGSAELLAIKPAQIYFTIESTIGVIAIIA